MSKKIIIFGEIHPKRANIFIPEITQDLYHLSGYRIGSFTTKIQASEITAVLDIQEFPYDNYETLSNSIIPRIEAVVDGYGFLTGAGYGVELTKLIDVADGIIFEFPTYLETLPRVESYTELEEGLKLLYSLTMNEEGAYFQKCLSELRKALRYPFESPVHCFKAVESIRQIYGKRLGLDPEKNRNQAWEKLRNDLNIEKSLIQEKIQNYSDPIRHGEIREFTPEEREELLEATWQIVKRYIEKAKKDKSRV